MVTHPVALHGLCLDDVSPPSAVLLEQPTLNLVPQLLADLSDPEKCRERLASAIVCASSSSPGKLAHPAQRSLTVALADAYCKSVTEPQVDPAKIESSGLVVRRIPANARSGSASYYSCEAWMKGNDGSVGWFPLTKKQADLDPDPARRRGLGSGSAVLDAMFAKQTLVIRSESVSPAFVAPPQVRTALKKTVIYGVVPTTDPESGKPSTTQPTDDALSATVPLMLKSGTHHLPSASETITPEYGLTDWLDQQGKQDFSQFLALTQAAVVLYGLFDPNPTPNAVNLLNRIQEITLVYADLSTIKMGDLLSQAGQVLLGNYTDAPPDPNSFVMTDFDYTVSDDLANRIFAAIKLVLLDASAALAPRVGRFDEPNRLYEMRMFIRVKDTPQCPPRVVWTDPPTGPFQIAPWYEPGNQPPVHIPLPDPTDRNLLQALKPNVSFGVPGALQQMMQSTNMQGLMGGAGGSSGGVTVDWICAFSIPIITICAFFVLNIFLILLNLAFFWLPFIKICIPIPVPKKS